MNISTTVIFAASDVSLTSEINVLNRAGNADRNACGSTMRRMMVTYDIFVAYPASNCPRGTASIAPRRVSDAYAPTLSENAMIAEGIAGMVTPMDGRPKKITNSCTSSGVPRNTHT